MLKLFNLKNEKIELILVLAIIFTIFSMPLAKSTYFFGYDPFFYLMMTKEILDTNNISTQYNHPPLYPTIFALLSIFSSLPPFYLIRYSLPFLVTFIGASMYIFARELTKNHNIALLAMLFVCLSSGFNFHWFYQFHVNYIEHRPAYLSWVFNLLFFYSLSKFLKKKTNFIVPGIFLGASFFTYFLSSALAAFSFMLLTFLLLSSYKKRKNVLNLFSIFLVTFTIFAPFFFLNLQNIMEIINIERFAILRAREPIDYFVFHGFLAVFAIPGFLYSIKKRYTIPIVWFLVLAFYTQGYWLSKVELMNKISEMIIEEPFIRLFPLSELVVRDWKVPSAFFASIFTFLLIEKLNRKKIFSIILLIAIILLICSPAIYGIIITEPFTYTERVPVSAFEFLKSLPNATIVSDELTTMMAYIFADKSVIAGMYPKAGNFIVKREDQHYVQHQLEDSRIMSERTLNILKKYDVKYFMLNFDIWGRIKREIDYNEKWNKVLDSDEASIFVLRT